MCRKYPKKDDHIYHYGYGGRANLDENLLKRLTVRNDVMVLNIEDAYLTGERLFDLDKGNYERDYMLHDKKLHEAEFEDRKKTQEKAHEIYKRYMISRC